MDTSGVMVFARHAAAQRGMQRQFAARQIHKIYHACVEGAPPEAEGVIRCALRKDLSVSLPPRHVVDCVRGRAAETHYRVLHHQDGRTRIELRPRTGRSHQLRVHLQALGCPILGDPIYGGGKAAAPRMMLHAVRLTLRHPGSGRPLEVSSPAPF
jgi:tRNA pseudouridine32 synthase/23S rRNA pseudouridine746 synthase